MIKKWRCVMASIDLRKYRLLLEVNERLTKSRLAGDTLSNEEYSADLTAACETLSFLSGSDEFKDIVRYFDFKNHNKADVEEARRVFFEFEYFVDYLRTEKGWLIENGVSEEAADALIANQTFIKDTIDVDRGIDAEAAIVSISNFANEVCRTANTMRDKITDGEKFYRRLRTGIVCGGALISVINGGVAIGTGGALLPYAIASGLIGTGSMGFGSFFKR
jgi:hypothetical protein